PNGGQWVSLIRAESRARSWLSEASSCPLEYDRRRLRNPVPSRSGTREVHGERRALLRPRHHGDPPALALDECPRDRQPKAEAWHVHQVRGFAPVEALEEPRHLLRRGAWRASMRASPRSSSINSWTRRTSSRHERSVSSYSRAGRGRRSVTSSSARRRESGERSSCEASAVKRRWASKLRSSRSSMSLS